MNNIYNFVWKESVWLPENYTWTDFATQNNAPTGWDLFYPIFPVAVSLIFLRSLAERYYLKPLGKRWGVGRAKLNKFSDSGWRFICYITLWTFGFLVLVRKPWFADSHYFWKDFPLQGIDNDVWWYYTLVVGYYWSLVINQFSEGRRKDFWMMFAHHVITLSLLCFSWMINITRIGSMFNLIHDIADVPLELTKICIYANKQRMGKVGVTILAFTWVVTRLIIFPLHILRSAIYETSLFFKEPPVGEMFRVLSYILFAMHIVWTYFIMQVCINCWKKESIQDSRSDDEDDEKTE